jgi:hypothetical protein
MLCQIYSFPCELPLPQLKHNMVHRKTKQILAYFAVDNEVLDSNENLNLSYIGQFRALFDVDKEMTDSKNNTIKWHYND